MKLRHIILYLLSLQGEINSKTKLQKLLYFLSLRLSKDFGFSAHFYGPYSRQVEAAMDELIGAGFVNVTRDVWGIDANRGFEMKRYNFSLTDMGKNFAPNFEKENYQESKKIKDFVEQLNDAGNPDYFSLSIAAKACHILLDAKKPMAAEQIESRAKAFNWEVEQKDIVNAISILKKLHFVE
jgi:uncharacterized protein YwgA